MVIAGALLGRQSTWLQTGIAESMIRRAARVWR
jgi:hypothetical protein